jgi:uncharacterized protein YndB with AHSA1/START domain
MPANDYHFVTRWRVEATPEKVFRVLGDGTDLPRWWPDVWLKAELVEPGDADGVGSLVRFHSRGWLPYSLTWQARTVEKVPPSRIVLRASGDFDGTGVWTLTPDGLFTDAVYDWTIRADKPLLKYLSFLFKPLFSWNHRWAMSRGLEALKRELARRQAS